MSRRNLGKFVILVFLWLACTGVAQDKVPHPFTLDDLLSHQAIDKIVPSPDGEKIAVVIQRPAAGNGPANEYLYTADRADVWLITVESGEARNLTGGEGRESYFSPRWSPDGQHLAMLSTEGTDGVRLYVWSKATDTVRRLTEASVDVEANFGGSFYVDRVATTWLNNTDLLTVLLPDGEIPIDYFNSNPQGVIVPKWETTQAGLEPSVSVLRSQVDAPQDDQAQSRLARIDVESGEVQTLTRGTIRAVSVSPDGRRAALIAATDPLQLPLDSPLEFPDGWNVYTWRPFTHFAFAVLDLEAPENFTFYPQIIDPNIFTFQDDIKWSSSSDSVAVLAKSSLQDEVVDTLFTVDVESEAASVVSQGVTRFTWRGDDLLSGTDEGWQFNAGSGQTVSSEVLASLPHELLKFGADGLVGIEAGEIYLLGSTGKLVNQTQQFDPEIQRIAWPSDPNVDPNGQLLLKTSDGLYLARAENNLLRMDPVAPPEPGANLLAYAPSTDTAIYTMSDDTGNYLWVGDPVGGEYEQSFALNTYMAQVAEPVRLLFEYENTDGTPLNALVLLPHDYREGQSYPLVVRLYAGAVIRDENYSPARKNQFRTYHPYLYTSRGYAVLYPSIPMPDGQHYDPLQEVNKSVLPAVDELIEMGIADADRLAVVGHSYGGYATLAVLTQTDRFQVAIASAPFVDLADYHDMIPMKHRYVDHSTELGFTYSAELENRYAVLRMGSTPWQAPERFRRNSPLSYADQISTPLMLIQGDLDSVPIQQSEALFKRLHRQGNEAIFVRYWGEGHTIQSPANIRDVWQRITRWLEEYIGPGLR